ncbi:MAG TPA: DUF58 domain-containing protein [Chloroflexi bacterium]|nr:DUF58 domain-containing protein [Chloroflexota bacterium]
MVRTSIRLTSALPVVTMLVLLILHIFSPAPPAMFVLIVLLGVLGASYFWATQMARNVTVQRQRRYGWSQVGDVIEERFTMHNESILPVLWAEVRDFSDLPGYNASRGVGLSSRATTRWMTGGTCERRGIYRLGPLTIRMGDPFGLFDVRLIHDYTEEFVVYPPVVAMPHLVEPRGMARGSARANIRSADLTTNAASVRSYSPGDALNRIHWRSTARRSVPDHEQIFVKEFDLEPSGDLWIIVDLYGPAHAGEDMESTEEYAVVLAASVANQMLRDNHAVGLITHTDEPLIIPPQKGYQQLWELLRALADVHAVSEVPLDRLLHLAEPIIGRGMTALLITPSTDPRWIQGLPILLRHGIHPVGVLLDAASFGGQGEVVGIVSALADLGVPSRVIDRGYTFDRLIEKRRQKPEYRVLGTGRVVMTDPGEQAEWIPLGQRETEP